MTRPLAIDLFCGLGGWAEGFSAAGFRVVGFDIANMGKAFGAQTPDGCQLVIQDVLTLHGSQFRDAAVIVASPPCQNYSYLAMPWSRSKSEHSQKAKAMRRKWETEGPDNRLFDACFRIQMEAIKARMKLCKFCCGPKRPTDIVRSEHSRTDGEVRSSRAVEETGHVRALAKHEPDTRREPSEAATNPCPDCYIPLIVENVRGAQPWVGRSAWNYGSFHLWGDVPALMPFANRVAPKRAMDDLKNGVRASHSAHLPIGAGPDGRKANPDGTNHPQGSWFRIADSAQGDRGQKVPVYSDPRRNGARSSARKMASAMIAKIPRELAEWIARVYYPRPA